MKALLVLGLVAGTMASAQASANTYWGLCQGCSGSPQSGAWYTTAAGVAAANSAVVDDLIWLCRDNNPSVSVVAEYVVLNAPVTDIDHVSSVFSDVSCAALGFE